MLRMRVRLCASHDQLQTLLRILGKFSISVDEASDLVIAQKGFEPEQYGLLISFVPEKLHQLLRLLSELSKPSDRLEDEKKVLIGRKHHSYELIQPSDILYFKAEGNLVFCVTHTTQYELKYKLYEVEKKVPGGSFIRIGKSHVVNILKVQEIIPWFGSRLLLRIEGTKERLEVSRFYVQAFKEYLGM